MEELISPCVPRDFANYKLPDPALLLYYQDLDDRVLWLNDVVDLTTLEITQRVIRWNMEDVGLQIEERVPIKIFINSPGGYLHEGLAVVDTMLMSKTPIYTICVGLAASAASLIFIAGSRRFMLPHSRLLFHQGSATLSGNASDVQSASKDYEKLVESMKSLILERCSKLNKAKLTKQWKSGDWYVNASEAIEMGAAEAVVENVEDLM